MPYICQQAVCCCAHSAAALPQVRQAALSQVLEVARGLGCEVVGTMESPLKGDRAGNTEYLVHLVVGGGGTASSSLQQQQQQLEDQVQQQ
jgi:hypothetical protein